MRYEGTDEMATKFHNQTACVKCTARMSKDLRVCPICGAAQGTAVTTNLRVTPAAPSKPHVYNGSYKGAPGKAPMTAPPLNVSSGSRKGSELVFIACGGVAVVGFVSHIATTHQNASMTIRDTKSAAVLSSAPSHYHAAAPEAHALVARTTPAVRPTDSVGAERHARALAVLTYVNALAAELDVVDKSLQVLADEFHQADPANHSPAGPEWKSRLLREAEQVDLTTNPLNTLDTPPECTALQMRVRLFATACDRLAHSGTNAAVNLDVNELRRMDEDVAAEESAETAIERELDSLKAQYTN